MVGFDRRELLASLAATGMASGKAAASLPQARFIHPASQGHHYDKTLTALADHVLREMAVAGLPGLTLCVTDVDGFSAELTFGYADVERREPVRPDHLFQIGSISKSLCSVALLTLVDEGKLDLGAPLARYLPEAALPAEPITIAQVMSHSAGLPDDTPIFPRTPEQRLWCGFTPGSDFSYSNTGYHLLGLLLGKLSGMPHPEAIRRRVLAPLGMDASVATIAGPSRARSATGYAPMRDDRAYLPGQPLAPGPWTDMDGAEGSVLSTPGDMARYLRFLLACGVGKGGRILSDASAKRLSTPLIDCDEFGPDARYGLGLATVPVAGKPCLHHTGGMILFASSFHADPEAGVACFASSNVQLGNGYRPRRITAYAIELLRAARGRGKAPEVPDAAKPLAIAQPDRLVGRFVAADGTALEIAPVGPSALVLRAGGREGRLLRQGEVFVTDHPTYELSSFMTVPGEGAVSGLWWCETLFQRDAPAEQPAVPVSLRAIAGHYLSTDPWIGELVVYAQGDRLVMPDGTELTEREGYWAKVKDKGGVERFRFDAPINGRASRASMSGKDMFRVTFG